MSGLWPALGLAGLLTGTAVIELLAAPVFQPSPPQMVLPPAAVVAATDGTLAAQSAAIVLARPLFRAARRPLAAVAVVVDDSLPRLSAIVITAAGRNAIFVGSGGTMIAVAVGGRVGAYQVEKIASDRVRLLGPDGEVTAHPQFAGLNPTNGAAPDTSAPTPVAPSGRLSDGHL